MRLDQFLVLKKLAVSRTQAHELIVSGHVYTQKNGQEVQLKKPSHTVSDAEVDAIFIKDNNLQKYVSRGGNKIESAANTLKLKFDGKTVLDVGQSTGGFTDFLIQHNSSRVVGIDVGHGQLHESLKTNSKVIFFESLHVKDLVTKSEFLESVPNSGFDIIVMDVSFISITKVMSHVKKYLKLNGEFLFLVKPQFELTADDLDNNGIVKNSKSFVKVQARVEEEARLQFGSVLHYIPSEMSGKDGNQEFFIYGHKTI